MPARSPRSLLIALVILFAACAAIAQTGQRTNPSHQPPSPLVIANLGIGTAPLDGPWQFHLGDNPAWADPKFDDSQWEQLSADKPWGAQGHENYTGFAWYRLHLKIRPFPGTQPNLNLFIPPIQDAYVVYWNGIRVGQNGSLPPDPSWYLNRSIAINLGPAQSGTLAFRVWRAPLLFSTSGYLGGFTAPPHVGLPEAVAEYRVAQSNMNYLRGLFYFILLPFYFLATLLSLLAWLSDRAQSAYFWMSVFCVGVSATILLNCGIAWPTPVPLWSTIGQTCFAVRDIALWYLLLWLLDLGQSYALARTTRIAAVILLIALGLHAILLNFAWASSWNRHLQIAEAIVSVLYTLPEFLPLVLIVVTLAGGKRLNHARWALAIATVLTDMLVVVRDICRLGVRFTHWTLAGRINSPLLFVQGSPIFPYFLTDSLVLAALVYAVYRFSAESDNRRAALEQEFKSARELQQALIPEVLPSVPGFALTSAYRPAFEVGGDFFQIIPLEGSSTGSTLIVLGDVSGKGLKAAMAVSLIVGAIRMAAESTNSPAAILAALNRRLHGRLQGGFATCIAVRLAPDGGCMLSSAGHIPPFLNSNEIALPGAFPLGLIPQTEYEETAIQLNPGDRLALCTDGLLEARNAAGELYGFDRMKTLFATSPTAAQATEAAVAFGQDDDITVLTLTRLTPDQESIALRAAPALT